MSRLQHFRIKVFSALKEFGIGIINLNIQDGPQGSFIIQGMVSNDKNRTEKIDDAKIIKEDYRIKDLEKSQLCGNTQKINK